MKNLSQLLVIVLLFSISSCNQTKKKDSGWIQLFNGKDLNDWNIKITGYALNENFGNTFFVEDSLLKVRYDAYENFDQKFGHIFYKNQYSHYKIRVEYRFVGDQANGGPAWAYRNSGIMIHGQTAESMEINQDFPVSIEVQLLGGNGIDPRSTLNLCTPGTNVFMNDKLWTDHCTNSSSETFHGDQWVIAEVEVLGDSIIRHFVNGIQVMEYSQPQLDERDANYLKLLPADGNKLLKKGTISLQAESHPIDFRKIELLNLGDDCQ